MRILITDDDFVGRRKLRSILSPYGTCTDVSDGELAIRAFEEAHRRSEPFDLVSMDIDMPGLRGTSVVNMLRSWERHHTEKEGFVAAKVMMVTGMHDSKSVVSSFNAGCEAFITKPITPEKVRCALFELGLITAEDDAKPSSL